MTNREIEAYSANFEYGRKCWEEFAKTHPADGNWGEKPERKVVGKDPFAPDPKPESAPEPVPEPEPVRVIQPSQERIKYEEERDTLLVGFGIMALAICALVLFILL